MNQSQNEFEFLIKSHDWHPFIDKYSPSVVAKQLSLTEGVIIAYRILFNKEYDDELRCYARQLLQEIRTTHLKEWMSNWRYDGFLGDACHLTLDYEGKFAALKRAYDRTEEPPTSLLLALAGCYLAPGIASVKLEEAESLVKQALEQELSIEAVVLIRGICAEKKDEKGFDYWDNILQKAEKEQLWSSASHWPEFLDDISLD